MAKVSAPRRRSKTKRAESQSMLSLAYSDAVRDILALDGHFHLAGAAHSDGVYSWNGARWSHQPFPEPSTPARSDVAPMSADDAGDLAAVG